MSYIELETVHALYSCQETKKVAQCQENMNMSNVVSQPS